MDGSPGPPAASARRGASTNADCSPSMGGTWRGLWNIRWIFANVHISTCTQESTSVQMANGTHLHHIDRATANTDDPGTDGLSRRRCGIDFHIYTHDNYIPTYASTMCRKASTNTECRQISICNLHLPQSSSLQQLQQLRSHTSIIIFKSIQIIIMIILIIICELLAL